MVQVLPYMIIRANFAFMVIVHIDTQSHYSNEIAAYIEDGSRYPKINCNDCEKLTVIIPSCLFHFV